MNCSKCDSVSSVTLRKKDHYCSDCFTTGTNHKFRACLGKSKILSKNEKVLICASGGPGSTVLLDLVHNGLSLDVHKKLRIIPMVLHVIDTPDGINSTSILRKCEQYNFNAYFIHISDYMGSNMTLSIENTIPKIDEQQAEKFQSVLDSMPETAYNDFVKKVKRHLFIQYAKLLECKFVFTAETTTSLAINLLSNLAIGRGSQVQNDVGFIDACDQNVKILRPMKDISTEELEYYIKIKGLNPRNQQNIKSNSLQAVISTFVIELQDNFQSTISTVCKTADKIGVHIDDNSIGKSCYICENRLTKQNLKLSALDATNFSRTVSFGKCLQTDGMNKTMFPYIDEHLCYSCSRNYSEMKHSDLGSVPNFLH